MHSVIDRLRQHFVVSFSMETMLEWVEEHATNQEFLKDFMLAWAYYERTHLPYQVPDLVRITGLLKSVGYNVTKVEKMEGESWAPGMVNGCTVEIQCPVSKTKITLSSPEAMCHCQKVVDSSWSLSWAGATTGLSNLNRSEMKIAIPAELTPGKAMMIRICLSSLMSIIWPRTEEKMHSPYPLCDRLVKSLDCVFEKERDFGLETSRSLQYIGSDDTDSMLTSSLSSLANSPHDSSEVGSCTSTPMITRSSKAASGSGVKNTIPRSSLLTPKFQPKQPPANSPYWESSTAKAKKYADMLKEREAAKKKPK